MIKNFIFFSGLYINSCVAKDINDLTLSADEMMIKKFSFSYCLNQTENQALKMEASLAMGEYFQHGSYDEPAYKNLKQYIDAALANEMSTYQSIGHSAILMNS